MVATNGAALWFQKQRDLLGRWRDQILSNPRFIEGARRFPLTRPIARRRARALFDLCAGFVYSQVLFACVELDLFTILAAGPRPIDRLAARVGVDPQRLLTLARAAASLQLLEFRGEGVGLGALGAALAGNPGIAAMVKHHALLYADLADPVALLKDGTRRTSLGEYWAYPGSAMPAGLDGAGVSAYSGLMAASLSLVAAEVLDAYSFARHRRILDVGGGEGGFLCAIASRYPELSGVVFDLPAVAARAEERIARQGLARRIEAVGGDFRRDPLPSGADLICLTRVLHDHDDASVAQLLRAAHAALAPGAALLVIEPFAGTAGAEPIGDAYFGLYLLAMGSGRPRTAAELASMLEQAGFVRVRRINTFLPLQTGILHALRGPGANQV